MTRSYTPGVERLLSLDRLATLRLCLGAEDTKMVVKTLFILMSYFSPAQGEVRGEFFFTFALCVSNKRPLEGLWALKKLVVCFW